jgi:hypothetical protein
VLRLFKIFIFPADGFVSKIRWTFTIDPVWKKNHLVCPKFLSEYS